MTQHSLDDIRNALAQTIKAGVGVGVYTYAQVRDKGQFPAVVIEPATANFNATMNRGMDDWDFSVFVLVRGADETTAQRALDGYLTGDGPNSIRRAIYDNRSLGGLDGVDANVYAMRGYGGRFQWAGVDHMGAILKVRIIIS